MYGCGFPGAGGGWSGGGWSWLGMGLWWLVLLGAIVWWVVAVVRCPAPLGRGPGSPQGRLDIDAALHILRERYARGEIETEDFDRRRAGLA